MKVAVIRQLVQKTLWRQLQTQAPEGIPQGLFDLLEPSPLALSVVSS